MQQINFILGKLLLSRFAQLLSFELLYQSFSSTRSHYNAQIKDLVDAVEYSTSHAVSQSCK